MDLYSAIFEVIDMRSFSNLWYWIVLAAIWSSSSHWVLGVPYDMMMRAKRHGGQAQQDFEDMVRININRVLFISTTAGLSIVALGCAFLAFLGISGFWYRVEFSQAVFLIAFPMSGVGLLTVMTSRKIRQRGSEGEDLFTLMRRHRVAVQFIGMIAIFVSALWGMYQNINVGPFGG